LQKLSQQINQLADLLSMARSSNNDLQNQVMQLTQQLESEKRQRAQSEQALAAERQQSGEMQSQLAETQTKATQAQTNVDTLTQQIEALRQQLAQIAAALDVSETKNQQQQAQLADLGERLNKALLSKVEELARYRSEFFGRLRDALGDRPDIQIVGDRFIFQSEVLFDPANAQLSDSAKQRLQVVAAALKDISTKIPPDIAWVLRVDGHTDKRPIATAQFPSNWELSAARAISVVNFLISQGIPADKLAAAGFGEYQPVDPANTDEAYRKNRRIELKLTER